jgi:hypothetical protein
VSTKAVWVEQQGYKQIRRHRTGDATKNR